MGKDKEEKTNIKRGEKNEWLAYHANAKAEHENQESFNFLKEFRSRCCSVGHIIRMEFH